VLQLFDMMLEIKKQKVDKYTAVRLNLDQWNKIKKIAKENKVKSSDIIRHSIDEFLKKQTID